MFLVIILMLAVVIVIPILILRFLHRWLKKKGHKRLSIIVPTLIILFIGYAFYTAVYPDDSFYREDFEKYSGVKFPASGSILKKDASYPDLHGHYFSMALVQLSPSDYQILRGKLNESNSSTIDSAEHPFLVNTSEFINDPTHELNKDFLIVYKIKISKLFTIGFYKDGKTILFEKGI